MDYVSIKLFKVIIGMAKIMFACDKYFAYVNFAYINFAYLFNPENNPLRLVLFLFYVVFLFLFYMSKLRKKCYYSFPSSYKDYCDYIRPT